MKINQTITIHASIALTSDIDKKLVMQKIQAIEGIVFGEKSNNKSYFIRVTAQVYDAQGIENFIEKLKKIIEEHGIPNADIDIHDEIYINNE